MTIALCETEKELRDMDNMMDVFMGQVSICKESGGKSAGIGFGEYLLYEGKINANELECALNYQKEGYAVLGVLAVQEDRLSVQQLCDVLDHQRERGGLFGEIAVEMGFISEEDVDTLLKMQGEKHIRIGEVLVLFGAIRRDHMESCLQSFHASV